MSDKKLIQKNNGSNLPETLLECNRYTQQFGLSLTKEDAQLLVTERVDSLRQHRRVEFGEGILAKLIFTFCDSPFISQNHYVEIIGRLQDIFYLYKNESMDVLSDDELLSFMKEKFDGECQGSADYLEDTVLEAFARKMRQRTRGFIGRDSEIEIFDEL